MDSKTLSHRQQWQHIESHTGESFHSILLYVLALSLYIFIRSPYMSSFISLLERKELQNLLKIVTANFFFPFSSSDPSGSGRRRDLCGICPLRKVKGAAGIQNHLDLGFIRFSKGLWRHEKSGGLICCGGGLFATDTRHTIVLRMFFVLRTYSLHGRGSRGRGALSRGELQLPSEN